MPGELSTQPLTPDDDALDRQVRLFLECRPLIQAHIASMVRDASPAEDVFQEVWLRFERITRHGEVIGNVLGWCRSAVRLVALESWRKQLLPEIVSGSRGVNGGGTSQSRGLRLWEEPPTVVASAAPYHPQPETPFGHCPRAIPQDGRGSRDRASSRSASALWITGSSH